MKRIKIIDIELDIPADVQVTTAPPEHCRLTHTFDGPSLAALRETLEREAQIHGYQTKWTPDATHFSRGEQVIQLSRVGQTRLIISVLDGELLPVAQVTQHGIELAGVALPVPGAAKVEPRRERHEPGSTYWTAEWRISNAAAPELASLVHEALVHVGLRSSGVWSPPKGGIPRWKVKGESAQQHVELGITEAAGHLDVEMTVIRQSDLPSKNCP